MSPSPLQHSADLVGRIWRHPANRPLPVRLGRLAAFGGYQLRKQLGLFPAAGEAITWERGLRVQLLRDSQLSQACLYYGLGDWPSMQFLLRALRPGDLCADIGANVGLYSLLLASVVGPARLHAFECLPRNAERLRHNLALNGFGATHVHACALGAVDGPVTLQRSDDDATASICPDAGSAAEATGSLTVPCRRLDGFAWPERFLYIKIDVEGAEQLVLEGASGLLAAAPPWIWSFECLDLQQRLGSSREGLLAAFARWGYRFFLYDPESNRLVPFGPHSRRRDDNVLAIHSDALGAVTVRLCGADRPAPG